jgi:hypothetical protein
MNEQQEPSPPSSQQFKVIKLAPNGPAPGQSVNAWLYGKDQHHRRQIGKAQWKRLP